MTSRGNTVVPIATTDESSALEASFEELFRAHYDRLVRALTVVANDRERAADAVQEAFVKAHLRWRRVGRYDDPIGWIRRVAVNKLRDDHRRDRRKRRAIERLASQPEENVEIKPRDDLAELLGGLPKQQRAVVALYYVDGESVGEIATALGIADGTVKSHLHDARRKLRGVLEAQREEEDR